MKEGQAHFLACPQMNLPTLNQSLVGSMTLMILCISRESIYRQVDMPTFFSICKCVYHLDMSRWCRVSLVTVWAYTLYSICLLIPWGVLIPHFKWTIMHPKINTNSKYSCILVPHKAFIMKETIFRCSLLHWDNTLRCCFLLEIEMCLVTLVLWINMIIGIY